MADRDVTTRVGKTASLNIADHNQNINAFISTSEEQTGATYEVVYTDQGKLIELNNASMVCTLDAVADIVAASDTGVDNFMVTLKNTNASEATINRSSTDTIDGKTSITLTLNQSITLQTNAAGDGWLNKQQSQSIYAGRVNGNDPAGSSFLPDGWSAASSGTGSYTITHNLNLSSHDYAVIITMNIAGPLIAKVVSTAANDFNYLIEQTDGTNTNATSSFIVMVI